MGKFTNIAPKPIGTRSKGSHFFTMAKYNNTPPTISIVILPTVSSANPERVNMERTFIKRSI
jgi:hypothetical protein